MKSRDLKERDKQFEVFERGILLARAEGNFYRYTSSPRLLQYWVREGPQAGWQSAISVPFPLECLEEAVREPLDWTGQLLFPFALPVAEGFYPAYVSYFREFDPEAVRLVSALGRTVRRYSGFWSIPRASSTCAKRTHVCWVCLPFAGGKSR